MELKVNEQAAHRDGKRIKSPLPIDIRNIKKIAKGLPNFMVGIEREVGYRRPHSADETRKHFLFTPTFCEVVILTRFEGLLLESTIGTCFTRIKRNVGFVILRFKYYIHAKNSEAFLSLNKPTKAFTFLNCSRYIFL